jgi:hypothetical protein
MNKIRVRTSLFSYTSPKLLFFVNIIGYVEVEACKKKLRQEWVLF